MAEVPLSLGKIQMANGIPRYAAVPLRRLLDSCDLHNRLLFISMRGISTLITMPSAMKILVEGRDDSEYREIRADIPVLEKYAEFAEQEAKAGFPAIHAHTLVALWTALEVGIEDMLVGILLNEPALLAKDAFTKIRVSLAEYEQLDREERMRFLVSELGRSRSVGKERGISGFESLLGNCDLSGDVDEEVRNAIWEMNHLRNVIVHRGSVADRRLITACPKLGLRQGQEVIISHEMVGKYGSAVVEYAWIVIQRLGRRYGVDVEARAAASGKNARVDAHDPPVA